LAGETRPLPTQADLSPAVGIQTRRMNVPAKRFSDPSASSPSLSELCSFLTSGMHVKSVQSLKALLLLVLAALCVTRRAPATDGAVRYEASHNAMGTVFTVAAYGADARQLAEVVNEAFEEIDRVDAQMSNYQPQSELSSINRHAATESVLVEPQLFRLLEDSLRYGEETGGAFDITVGPLMRAWGFFRGRGRMPARSEIHGALEKVGCQHVHLDPATRTIRFDTSGIEIDLGGIAKGYAVDRAVDILRTYGVTQALVSSGTSTIYALGAPPHDHAWRITIRDPFDAEKAGDVVFLKNFALSVSGNYEKFFELDGKIYSHILDPRTGRPAENLLSTAVLAPLATQADALSTALFVLGVEGGRRYLSAHPNLAAVFYQPADSPGVFKRTLARSPSFKLPPDSLAEIQGDGEKAGATERKGHAYCAPGHSHPGPALRRNGAADGAWDEFQKAPEPDPLLKPRRAPARSPNPRRAVAAKWLQSRFKQQT
jgi:thiamine biosynthesis lipoprotein